ncbi:ABC transporter, ATP binding protein related protein [mine drainage metagenome]|uniref:ABC transporter, ATP binding protein related protein n=1 Tax=mine drainage metagenome TaxID=410659 RepID=T0YB17_9ZZZZ
MDATFKKRITAVIGRNGAGKTTLMRILSTQLLQSSGKVLIDGLDNVRDAKRIRKTIVSIPQEADPLGYLTPMEHLKMYLCARGMSLSDATREATIALRELELWHARDTSSDMLSGGMKRKIFVAMALAANADTVFLDEPTTGLDPLSRLEVWSAIKRLKGTMVLTTHYMEEAAELSDEVFMVETGKIIAKGDIKSLLSKFNGLLRAETSKPVKAKYKIGNTSIEYIKIKDAERYVKMGYSIKPITLDDLFVMRGVNIES